MVVIPVIGFGAFIEPFFDLRMTVGKIKPAGPVMVTGWEINDPRCRGVFHHHIGETPLH